MVKEVQDTLAKKGMVEDDQYRPQDGAKYLGAGMLLSAGVKSIINLDNRDPN